MSITKLRAHLTWITVNALTARSEALHINRCRAQAQHSIQVLNSPDDNLDYNCVMYALALVDCHEYREHARNFEVKAETPFVQYMIDCGTLVEHGDMQADDLCVYFDGATVEHIGRSISSSLVRSKWGWGRQLYEHALFEVPQTYGSAVRFYAAPERDVVLNCFVAFANMETGRGY